ncbi:maleylpyruvate isomerase family mycothiol-dependent enzyme [Nocardioides sp.]|uniref:maleylpyruvate isomerase family mycothiol-dependent enzyme n=1 Tax=Nocardioides sp. TaxID=35761 RepID=UPI0035298E25
MTAALRDRQLQRLCDVLDAVDADADTWCAGWTAHDLAVHVWTLKRDPLGWPGVVVPRLGRGRAARIHSRWEYADLVGRLRREPGGIAAMPLDRWEDHRHALGEYWMHTQDVARPQGVPQPPVDDALAEALWLRVQRAAHALHRRTRGLTLVHPDGRRAAVTRGAPTVVVTGEPPELMCWAYGRPAEVRVERPGS